MGILPNDPIVYTPIDAPHPDWEDRYHPVATERSAHKT